MPPAKYIDALAREIRLASERLGLVATALQDGVGVTGAMRGVIEALGKIGPATVPQLARRLGVSRQHVQSLVDSLWERRLCRFSTNPAHARSPLVELSDRGRAVLEVLEETDQAMWAEIASELPADVTNAVSVLRRLNAALLRRLPEP